MRVARFRIAFLVVLAAIPALASARPVAPDPALITGDDSAEDSGLPYIQCVPYARQVSGIQIRGDAHTWWGQAEGRYAKGRLPRVGLTAPAWKSAMPPGPGGAVRMIDWQQDAKFYQFWIRAKENGSFEIPDVRPGTYTLRIDGNTTGAYGFRLLDLASATVFAPGTPQSGTLTPGNSTALYAFDATAGDTATLFTNLKQGLTAPLGGMGTAFSCSMFGLAGSLILGFLDLQAGHAQSRERRFGRRSRSRLPCCIADGRLPT